MLPAWLHPFTQGLDAAVDLQADGIRDILTALEAGDACAARAGYEGLMTSVGELVAASYEKPPARDGEVVQ
jgi:hypothetical protein